jgi:hypothetical protein
MYKPTDFINAAKRSNWLKSSPKEILKFVSKDSYTKNLALYLATMGNEEVTKQTMSLQFLFCAEVAEERNQYQMNLDTSFILACYYGNLNRVKAYIDKGANVNCSPTDALDFIYDVERTKNHGVQLNASKLRDASLRGYTKLLLLLGGKNAAKYVSGLTPNNPVQGFLNDGGMK